MLNIKTKLLKIIFLMLFICNLTACKTKMKGDDGQLVPINELYQTGTDLLECKKYKQAAEVFDKLFYQYPGHDLTPKAELLQAYSLYQAGSYNEAIDVLDNFINMHPMHDRIEYAYDLRATIALQRMSHVTHDQSRTLTAKSYCEDLIKRFPDSVNAKEKLKSLNIINEHLAGQFMVIGRYYFENNNPLAALIRFKDVINNYPKSEHVSEALYRSAGCYLQLGLKEEAQCMLSILKSKYSNSKWYNYANGLLAVSQ